ncbi:MAG: hypothetical protein ACKO3R_06865 [bacterium]
MAIQNNSSLFLTLPKETQERVSNLATGLITAIKKDEKPISPDSLLGFLTNLIRGENPNEASTNTQDWLTLLQNTQNQKQKEQIATRFILEHAPKYFTENNKYNKDKYLERFLPTKLTDEDFKHLQRLAQEMNPPENLQDTPKQRTFILNDKKANLKATLGEWFNYLNDENGGLAYLDNKTRHWIFNSVANLELRILDDKPKLKTLEEILKKPETINSHTEIDANAFAKFKDILGKYQSGSLDQEKIKNEISEYTARDPNLDFGYKEKLSKLFSNDEIDKVTLYSLVLNDPRGTKVNFQNRQENSIKDFPVLNPALIAEINDIVTLCETQTATNIEAEIKEKYAAANPEFAKFLVDNIQINKGDSTSSLNFAALYAFLQNQSQKEIDLTTTDGEWRKFPKGSDAKELRDSIKAFNTGWCIQGLETAQGYLNQGDFHVYFSKDPSGKATVPRLAIAMRDDQIKEIRGIAANQNLDPYIAAINENGQTILAEKLYIKDDQGTAVFPNSEQWLRADQDMKDLTILHTKFKSNQEFTGRDLFFIYQIFKNIESFGFETDPRINEILKTRNHAKDFERMMNLSELPAGELEKLRTQTDKDGNNVFMWRAAHNRNKESAEMMLKIATEGLDPQELKTLLSQANKNGESALMFAVWAGNEEAVKVILNSAEKLDPQQFTQFISQADKLGNNALIFAVLRWNKETAGAILNSAEKLDPQQFTQFISQADERGNNALTFAVLRGDKEALELILKTAKAKLPPPRI